MTTPSSQEQDRASRVPWPPIVFFSSLAGAGLLEWLAPLNLLPAWTTVRGLGWLIFALSFVIAISGIGMFRSIGTAVNPTLPASKLAQGGIYAWTRNPMYVGFSLGAFGLSLAFSSAWLLILAILMPLILQKLAIEPEEAYLSRRFGAEYDSYRARVRRWF